MKFLEEQKAAIQLDKTFVLKEKYSQNLYKILEVKAKHIKGGEQFYH